MVPSTPIANRQRYPTSPRPALRHTVPMTQTHQASASPIPLFGLGTYRLKGQTVIDAVTQALEIGYPMIDTAQFYENEAEVGKAIDESPVARDKVFITTKIWPTSFGKDQLVPAIEQSLHKLRLEQVDMVLAHWPSPKNEVPMGDYLGEMKRAKDEGKTKHIGVSNFPVALMKAAISILGEGQIATNQVEVHPYLQNNKVVEFAQANGIHITGYMTLAVGKATKDPVIEAIAKAHGATPAEVILAWAMQRGISVIPSSTSRDHLQSNFEAQKLKLSDDDMQRIAGLDRGERIANPESLAPAWD